MRAKTKYELEQIIKTVIKRELDNYFTRYFGGTTLSIHGLDYQHSYNESAMEFRIMNKLSTIAKGVWNTGWDVENHTEFKKWSEKELIGELEKRSKGFTLNELKLLYSEQFAKHRDEIYEEMSVTMKKLSEEDDVNER